ncbi:aldose epimerase family protein [Paraglaciecola sp. L3A3]|uniref:aldose epimerase family protein n=1 Tax=Paraglaciecola sp. L3A3 TaxID=2686358 RepID=UPI00131B4866|nr:aldose epimerase family protein [Paraglaciecola sp. L3A3]
MIKHSQFGTLANGQIVDEYTLTNQQGVEVDIISLGAILKSWKLPTKNGEKDIVLGFDTLDEYLADQSYIGATVGRYANRIAQGQFSLNGIQYQVDVNQAGNCLHGGKQGFHSYVWQAEVISEDKNPSVAFTITSIDGDQGFPGKIQVKVIYTLTEENTLRLEYFAKSDQDTLFNPTNHSYFNLAGHDSGSVAEHQVLLAASHYTPTDDNGIPTGEIAPVKNSPFDLSQMTAFKEPLSSAHPQIKNANGIDKNWCLDNFNPIQKDANYAGTAVSSASGVEMQIHTSMPGIQIYTANHFADMKGKNGAIYQAYESVCFESQFYADSPNQANFPSTTLKANDDFYSVTEYKVSF